VTKVGRESHIHLTRLILAFHVLLVKMHPFGFPVLPLVNDMVYTEVGSNLCVYYVRVWGCVCISVC